MMRSCARDAKRNVRQPGSSSATPIHMYTTRSHRENHRIACFDICVRVFVCYARAVLLVRGTARGLPIEGKGCFLYECSVERG